jgi:hypothetical protein
VYSELSKVGVYVPADDHDAAEKYGVWLAEILGEDPANFEVDQFITMVDAKRAVKKKIASTTARENADGLPRQ